MEAHRGDSGKVCSIIYYQSFDDQTLHFYDTRNDPMIMNLTIE